MAETAGHHEEMPDLVKSKHTGYGVGSSGCVDNCANRVEDPADDDPDQESSGRRVQDGPSDKYSGPTHAQVQNGREPARSLHPDNFLDDSAHRDRPDGDEQRDS